MKSTLVILGLVTFVPFHRYLRKRFGARAARIVILVCASLAMVFQFRGEIADSIRAKHQGSQFDGFAEMRDVRMLDGYEPTAITRADWRDFFLRVGSGLTWSVPAGQYSNGLEVAFAASPSSSPLSLRFRGSGNRDLHVSANLRNAKTGSAVTAESCLRAVCRPLSRTSAQLEPAFGAIHPGDWFIGKLVYAGSLGAKAKLSLDLWLVSAPSERRGDYLFEEPLQRHVCIEFAASEGIDIVEFSMRNPGGSEDGFNQAVQLRSVRSYDPASTAQLPAVLSWKGGVVDPQGRSVEFVQVYLEAEETRGWMRAVAVATPDVDGAFELSLPRGGRYWVYAEAVIEGRLHTGACAVSTLEGVEVKITKAWSWLPIPRADIVAPPDCRGGTIPLKLKR